uniref:Uncharacterized protein n=1 Tax=Anopheles maculatus TaxID=74869 RepID=A0A182TCS1_9DIPT
MHHHSTVKALLHAISCNLSPRTKHTIFIDTIIIIIIIIVKVGSIRFHRSIEIRPLDETRGAHRCITGTGAQRRTLRFTIQGICGIQLLVPAAKVLFVFRSNL